MNQVNEIEIYTPLEGRMFRKPNAKGQLIRVGASEAAEILIENTGLRHLRVYPSRGLFYLYLPKLGYYKLFAREDLKIVLRGFFHKMEYADLKGSLYMEQIVQDFEVNPDVAYGDKPDQHFAHHFVAMKTQLLNLQTMETRPFDPQLFVIHKLDFDVDPVGPIKVFEEYIRHLAEGCEDRYKFLRGILHVIVRGRYELQIFPYIYGPGGTGKSTLSNLAAALVGSDSVCATTLKALNTDRHETVNLIGKRLVIISDAENYTKDVTILKNLTGGDPTRGRPLYKIAVVINFTGIILMNANQTLNVRDSSNAIARRIRPFKVSQIPTSPKPLFHKELNGAWGGPLASELPGILNWVLTCPEDIINSHIVGFNKHPVLQAEMEVAKAAIFPMTQWVKDEVEPGKGAYVGFKAADDKQERQFRERRTLYPAYRSYNTKRGAEGLSHKQFSESLICACQELGIPNVKLVRKSPGMYIEGIQLKEEIFDLDYTMGAPIYKGPEAEWNQSEGEPNQVRVVTSKEELPKLETPTEPKGPDFPTTIAITANLDKSWPKTVKPSLYQEYHHFLTKKTPLKLKAGNMAKGIGFKVVNLLSEPYTIGNAKPSPLFLEGVLKVLRKGVEKIHKTGGIPWAYKQMGTSPRITPTNYGMGINSTKKVLRNFMYRYMASTFHEAGKTLLDVDIKACYTSVLLGLYPNEFEFLQKAIETVGLWESIKLEFTKAGIPERYNKSAVKVCVYASLFGGGRAAFLNSILESIAKDASMTLKEFKGSEDFRVAETMAQGVVAQMESSSVVLDFKSLAKKLLREYQGEFLTGPTGHTYLVTREGFRNIFPSFLQSFEFALLAESTLRLCRQYPEVELLGHYHDGNVIAVPSDRKEECIQALQGHIEGLGKEMDLAYTQSVEIQQEFQPLDEETLRKIS